VRRLLGFALGFLLSGAAFSQGRFQPGVKPFLATEAPVVALTHVRVIDGSGAPARDDQTVIVDHGKIAAVGPAASTPAPAGAGAAYRCIPRWRTASRGSIWPAV
jgi:hypothetical protein